MSSGCRHDVERSKYFLWGSARPTLHNKRRAHCLRRRFKPDDVPNGRSRTVVARAVREQHLKKCQSRCTSDHKHARLVTLYHETWAQFKWSLQPEVYNVFLNVGLVLKRLKCVEVEEFNKLLLTVVTQMCFLFFCKCRLLCWTKQHTTRSGEAEQLLKVRNLDFLSYSNIWFSLWHLHGVSFLRRAWQKTNKELCTKFKMKWNVTFSA